MDLFRIRSLVRVNSSTLYMVRSPWSFLIRSCFIYINKFVKFGTLQSSDRCRWFKLIDTRPSIVSHCFLHEYEVTSPYFYLGRTTKGTVWERVPSTLTLPFRQCKTRERGLGEPGVPYTIRRRSWWVDSSDICKCWVVPEPRVDSCVVSAQIQGRKLKTHRTRARTNCLDSHRDIKSKFKIVHGRKQVETRRVFDF